MRYVYERKSTSCLDTRQVADDLKAFLERPDFPCVGAKAALRRHQLQILVASDIRHDRYDRKLAEWLESLAHQYDANGGMFVSRAVIYPSTTDLSEIQFEACLWERLSALHAIDVEDNHWDPAVASDPSSPHFSLSIGGKGFFVVGLHPNASRLARRFKYPTLVFNLHDQFEKLREEGRYETLRQSIIARDVALQGYQNPMLARHGSDSEAAQYSGRRVDKNWKCPFRHV
ncbi:MAG TPA: guanitoxin biosynthesis heme-dependent pre-guanitoxin N-hydroxylase GntA [Hyphomicrobium sp.]|nr:guanitoxin biosynthesis heme-dependent pre-guanitoxin N-hydroxylase GntA [Hyphomicrobium sp.]